MVKFAGNGRLKRTHLNHVFGKKVARPDEECWAMERFLVSTVGGCDWNDIRCIGDLGQFMKEFGVTPVHFQRWFAQHDEKDPTWVVIEKQDGKPVWTWFKASRQMGPWVAIGEECPLTFKLVKNENGRYDKVDAKKLGITSINKLYGSCFGGACQGRHEVTSKIMKDPAAVDAILKIGLYWEKNRERMYDVPQDEEIRAIEDEFPSETACPSWIEHKDHMRFLWGYTIGRRAMVLFNQGKITEDKLYEEE
jgi:hypothetical protein